MKISSNPYVVFGANGFIGASLVDRLLESNRRVIAIDRFSNSEHQFRNLPEKVFTVDLSTDFEIEGLIPPDSVVVDALGSTTPWLSSQEPHPSLIREDPIFLRILKASEKAKIAKFVFCSSAGALYGDSKGYPSKETDPLRPLSRYGKQKLHAEGALREVGHRTGFEPLILRFSNLYGPGQRFKKGQGLVARAIDAAKKGLELPVFGDGNAIRDFIFIDDAIEAVVRLIERKAGFESYNIATGRSNKISDVLQIVEHYTGNRLQVSYQTAPKEFVERSRVDISRLESELEDFTALTLEEGIFRTLQSDS